MQFRPVIIGTELKRTNDGFPDHNNPQGPIPRHLYHPVGRPRNGSSDDQRIQAAADLVILTEPFITLTLNPLGTWLVPSSVVFARVHLDNPNVVPGFTFINTAIAGVWLAVAYTRTRSLWFPLGVHWSWNWMMGAVLGLPVSGIDQLTPAPLLRATDMGPDWITGGAYGIEGGTACTLALLFSTIFIWRTRFVSATEELKELTSHENLTLPQQLSIVETETTNDAGRPQHVERKTE